MSVAAIVLLVEVLGTAGFLVLALWIAAHR